MKDSYRVAFLGFDPTAAPSCWRLRWRECTLRCIQAFQRHRTISGGPRRGSIQMNVRNRTTFGFVFGFILLLSFALGSSGSSGAQRLGLVAKKPVVAAACKLCCAYRRSRPPIPTDRDHLFRSIATSVARVLTAPLDDGGDVSLLWIGQARQQAVPVVNRRDPRATRRALTADAAARAGGPC
jgi:hypothetical protein